MISNPAVGARSAYEMSAANARTESLSRRAAGGDSDELREVCQDFEALFVKMMLDSMRKTVGDGALIPKNSGEKLFEDKLYEEYAHDISRSAPLGIADMMYSQLENSLPGNLVNIG